MNNKSLAYLQIHLAVILFGLTGILGDLISLPQPVLVWWRMGLAAMAMLLIPGIIGRVRAIPPKARWQLLGIGGIVALHWVTFFAGIALTNVSVALACMATASFFVAILEPLLLPRKFKWYELLLGLMVIPGVILIYNSSDFGFWGMLVSLISAFLAAIFSILNKKMVDQHDSYSITAIELGSGFVLLSLYLAVSFIFNPEQRLLPEGVEILWLAILAFVCTSFAYVISLKALRYLSTFTFNLTINLEPIYTIILAFFLFAEHKELGTDFYWGAGIIISMVFSYPLINRFFEGKESVTVD